MRPGAEASARLGTCRTHAANTSTSVFRSGCSRRSGTARLVASARGIWRGSVSAASSDQHHASRVRARLGQLVGQVEGEPRLARARAGGGYQRRFGQMLGQGLQGGLTAEEAAQLAGQMLDGTLLVQRGRRVAATGTNGSDRASAWIGKTRCSRPAVRMSRQLSRAGIHRSVAQTWTSNSLAMKIEERACVRSRGPGRACPAGGALTRRATRSSTVDGCPCRRLESSPAGRRLSVGDARGLRRVRGVRCWSPRDASPGQRRVALCQLRVGRLVGFIGSAPFRGRMSECRGSTSEA